MALFLIRIRFQTVDTDFSPGDCGVGTRIGVIRMAEFQTVDTDFSPGDVGRIGIAVWILILVSDR